MATQLDLSLYPTKTQSHIQDFHLTGNPVKHFSDTEWRRIGTASDNQVSARALAYIVAGHELHHNALLRERYLAE